MKTNILSFDDYVKSVKMNENKEFNENDYKNMLKKYFIFQSWFGKNYGIVEELFKLFDVCFDEFYKKMFPWGLPNYEDYEEKDEYQQIFVDAIETIRDYITEENDFIYSKYYTISDRISDNPSYPRTEIVAQILGEMLNIYTHEKYDCFYDEWE